MLMRDDPAPALLAALTVSCRFPSVADSWVEDHARREQHVRSNHRGLSLLIDKPSCERAGSLEQGPP
jgi:hypothetical protein